GNVGVEDSERANHLAAGVREQRILDLVGLAEGGENLARVVGDRRGVDSGGLQRLQRLLQLDELIAAVGSPIGAAAEDQQQAVAPREIFQSAVFAVLVGQREIG